MKKSLFGSLLGFFLVVGLSLALSANPTDPKKAEKAKGCSSGKAKTEQAACTKAEKKGCSSEEKKEEKGSTETTETKENKTTPVTTPRRRSCC